MKTEIEGTTSHNPDPKHADKADRTDNAERDTAITQQNAPPPERRRGRALSPFDLWSAGPFELMRRFFGDAGFADLGMGELGRGWFDPKIDVFERADDLVVRADLPGVRKEDLVVEVAGDHLVIGGERHDTREHHEGTSSYRSERSYGSFHRTIPLPEGADVANASATFEHGVLEVTIKNPQRAQRRRIAITDGPKVH
jgi:HSP20 family protein